VTTTVEEPPRETTPADGARHGRDGISPRSVPPELGGVQAAAGSHQGFQAFQRALFADELRDIVGLYVDRRGSPGYQVLLMVDCFARLLRALRRSATPLFTAAIAP
jgi:hypothetical protein